MYDWKCQKTHISAISVHKYHKSCSSLIWPFYGFITTVWLEMSENSYLRHFQWTSITNRVLSLFDRFTAYYNCMTWNVRKLTSPPFKCTSITNRVLRLFDRFTVYYNCMTWNVRKLISPPLQCTSITNRFLSLFDHFTAYYNCMTWNVRKLISPPFQCTSIYKSCS